MKGHKETMEEYAKKRNKKKSEVTGVNISKAANGFIVRVEHSDYDAPGRRNQVVYENIEGVLKCVKEKLGGK